MAVAKVPVDLFCEEKIDDDNDNDDDDIYGDLETSVFANARQTRKNETDSKLNLLQSRYDQLEKDNARLKEKVRNLLRQNRTLATNISSLFKTAKAESDKKTFVITTLREKINELQKSSGQSSYNKDKKPPDVIHKTIKKPDSDNLPPDGLLPSSTNILLEVQKSIERLKSTAQGSTKIRKNKKTFKFGKNMTVYFCREQTSFPPRKKGEVSLVRNDNNNDKIPHIAKKSKSK